MIPTQTIEQLKQSVSITDYLYSKGLTPVNSTGKQYVYRSPLTNEKSASFFVEPTANVFNDFSSGEKGDNIRLVRLLEQVDFVTAVRRLEYFDKLESVPFSLSAAKDYILQPEQQRHEITAIKPLQHKALVEYVHSRRIPFHVAYNNTKEIHYRLTSDGRQYFGVGFPTDKGSFALRSQNFKSMIGASSISTVEVEGADSINLFEGFFNYLTALTYFRVQKMRNTTIVLNSASNLSKAMERLKAAKMVYTFLDNDSAGQAALSTLRANGCNVIDRAGLYAEHNDFNALLCSL